MIGRGVGHVWREELLFGGRYSKSNELCTPPLHTVAPSSQRFFTGTLG